MCHGPLAGKMIRYALPLALAYLLQLCFHAADMIIVGRFSSHESMAAIGATGDLITMMINLSVCFSGGIDVVVAQHCGAGDRRGLARAVHTAVALALAAGGALFVLGMALSRWSLEVTQVPDAVFGRTLLYLRITVAGMPFLLLYNFGCAIIRAMGDTVRPLVYLAVSGVLNVLLNLLFVIVFKLDVAGVALATVISQGLSAWLVFRALRTARGAGRLIAGRIRFYAAELKRMLWIGIPSGVQGLCYSLANVTIQSAINSLGPVAMAGNVSAVIIDRMLHTVNISFFQTVVAFVGQNFGARRYDRVRSVMRIALSILTAAFLVGGWGVYLCGETLLGWINPHPGVIAQGMLRLKVVGTTYFLLGLMDNVTGGLRGMGRSVAPALVTLFGSCGLRILWVLTVFPHYRRLDVLLVCLPLSWAVITLINGTMLWFVCRKLPVRRKLAPGTPV